MNKTDRLFKEKLNVPQSPPEDAWEQIEAALDKRKRRGLIWWPAAAVVTAALFLIYPKKEDQLPGQLAEQKQELPATKLPQERQTPDSVLPGAEQSESLAFAEEKLAQKESGRKVAKEGFLQRTREALRDWPVLEKADQNPVAESTERTAPVDAKKEAKDQQDYKVLPAQKENASPKEQLARKVNKESKTQQKALKQPAGGRISISTFFAPDLIPAFRGKSMLSPTFNDKTIHNTSAFSVGARVRYAVSDKVAIRTGIGVMSLEQSTSEVPMVASRQMPQGMPVFNALDADAKAPIAYESGLRVREFVHQTSAFKAQEELNPSQIEQKTQYLEIPVEAEIKIGAVDKVTFSVTAGGSSYLLTKNVLMASGDQAPRQKLGEATNLNDLSFSANGGIKVDYELSKGLKINVEPTFKYMVKPINALQEKQPYILGVKVGAGFSF